MFNIYLKSHSKLLLSIAMVLLAVIKSSFAQTEQRLRFSQITVSQQTGQDYSPWLSDSLDSLVQPAWTGNSVWVDITLKLQTPGKITKLSLYDFQGTCPDDPALIYALKGTQKTLLYTFTGPNYMVFEDTVFTTPIDADAIVVHKFGNDIPQKVFVSGYPTVLDTTVRQLTYTGTIPSQQTGQDYTPWLSNSLDSLVQPAWTGNSVWVDVKLPYAHPVKITKLSLYDYEGVFTEAPVLVYALKGTQKTLLYTFTGPNYMVFEDTVFTSPISADAIIVHKFGNSIPQKVFTYGYPDTSDTTTITLPPDTTITPVDTSGIVKIPIDGKRWYQLSNVSSGLDGLFDGILDADVNTGYGKLISHYDAYYPVAPGENIRLTKVKFFSYHGGFDLPFTLSVINSHGQRITVGSFTGYHYNSWVGPYPDRNLNGDAQFILDSTLTDIKYLVINCWGGYPTEMELYGHYTAPNPVSAVTPRATKLKQMFGINAFEWNFENGGIDPTLIDSTYVRAIKNFTQVRHYLDWDKLEVSQGSYTYNPTRLGGWNYDAIYQYCKNNGIMVLADLKQQPEWMSATYPDSVKTSENVPVQYGRDFSDPASYIEQAKVAFQFVARYGSNATVDTALLSVNGTQRWTGDPVNSVKRGLGVIKYIECDNERDKWWKGRSGYQTSYEYAANLSAFYDGNKNTMGPGVGVKNADTTVKVVMAGLAFADPSYVRGMVDWCKQHRGYKADGSVNLCWDVINYHYYSNDAGTSQNGQSTRGAAPEVNATAQVAKDFVQMAHEVAGDMPVWVTEVGYDINQGSPYKAIPIGTKTAAQTQADWILRSALLYARSGVDRIFFYQLYDDNAANPIQFGSSGLINDDKTRRPAADYLYQTNKLLGEYAYKETLNINPFVDRYELNGKSAYALVIPDEVGRTAAYQLDLPNVDSAKVYTPKIGVDSMEVQYIKTVDGKLPLTVTETPIFVIPIPGSDTTSHHMANFKTQITNQPMALSENVVNTLKLYPNPTNGYVTISFTSNDVKNDVRIRVSDGGTGALYKTINAHKSERDFLQTLDLSAIGAGVCIVEVKQGNIVIAKKVIRVN
ncbi:T9SS type A sorting domain-containing protein [Mucilaginibacter sp. HMF5004]|uniref:T9SS type A sorting domain-containing protein n=1 Tax=Mucilaginibacter rivuli TaxID=2857527 RepID=UPI001C5FE734|nr:T9SS type A sorting domain-containing protein [Mucilaginibacter rivuli]MBW4891896.1 T9SS type A sorting domain-containing protein [Mucilaginibacter rivuli]